MEDKHLQLQMYLMNFPIIFIFIQFQFNSEDLFQELTFSFHGIKKSLIQAIRFASQYF